MDPAQCVFKSGRGWQKCQNEGSEKKDWSAIAGFEDGRGPQAKECGQPLEAVSGTEMDSPLEL